MDNIKAYIYLLIDNFSRYILSWHVNLKLSADIRLKTIKEAYYRYGIKGKDTLSNNDTELMVDGDPENTANVIDTFINAPDVSMKKIIAQQEIDKSNG